jgi:hypothetical protein
MTSVRAETQMGTFIALAPAIISLIQRPITRVAAGIMSGFQRWHRLSRGDARLEVTGRTFEAGPKERKS